MLIATGWDAPTPTEYRDFSHDFARWGFDGTVIEPTRKTSNGTVVRASNAFSSERWEADEFTSAISDLKMAGENSLQRNFLRLKANPGNVDWFDDAGWKNIVHHWQLLARVAREGHLAGIAYDPECYTSPWQQFDYRAQPDKERHTFAAYAAQARLRGREVMAAVVAEYPNITILGYRLLSNLLPAVTYGRDPSPALAQHTYGLAPAFIDGWLDRIPSTVTLIEGNEDSYLYNEPASFALAYARIRINAPLLISPENRDKFRVRCQIAHAVYLDAYCSLPGSPWHIDLGGESASVRLAANATAAFAYSDGYVWFNGETGRWWPAARSPYSLWPDKLPGVDRALKSARDPAGTAREYLAAAQPTENLLVNGSFEQKGGGDSESPGWSIWQGRNSKGQFEFCRNPLTQYGHCALITRTDDGCLVQELAVQPSEWYVISVRVRNKGSSYAGIKVRWQTTDGSWADTDREIIITPTSSTAADDWQECLGLATVPPRADKLVLLLLVRNQHTDGDAVWFSDAKVMRISSINR